MHEPKINPNCIVIRKFTLGSPYLTMLYTVQIPYPPVIEQRMDSQSVMTKTASRTNRFYLIHEPNERTAPNLRDPSYRVDAGISLIGRVET